ncbi:MAG: hypothetical protein HYW45_03425 [Candidatus Daviesbacteria bacterium]|nr:MAG: hypothetical protein HYW45_03425 [Candidatus Daviesbacteria bacterium]
MTATAHALIGGAIASGVSNQPLGIALSFASHPLADLIPHWDFGWGWRKKSKLKLFLESAFDLGLGLFLSYFIFGINTDFKYFLACVFVSEVWDIMEAPYWLFNLKIPPFSWMYNIQHNLQGKAVLPWGIVTQVSTLVILVLLLQAVHPLLNS